MRNLQEQVKFVFANSWPSASHFKSFSQSVEHFFLTVGQNNFGNKIPLLLTSLRIEMDIKIWLEGQNCLFRTKGAICTGLYNCFLSYVPCCCSGRVGQKYSRLRCLLRVRGLVNCFYLGWSGSILQFRQNIIKVRTKSWLLTCSSNITFTFIHWLCFEERAKVL